MSYFDIEDANNQSNESNGAIDHKILSLNSRLKGLFEKFFTFIKNNEDKQKWPKVLERTSPGFAEILRHSGYGHVSQTQALRIFDSLFEERSHVTFEELKQGLTRTKRFKGFTLAQTADIDNDFEIDFNKDKTTLEMHQDDNGVCINKDKKIWISQRRKKFHDALLDHRCNLVDGSTGVRWIVVTCGKAYAGKSHVVHYMSESGILPLEHFVTINVNSTLKLLPEWQLYEAELGPEEARKKCIDEAKELNDEMWRYSVKEFQNIWVDFDDMPRLDDLIDLQNKVENLESKQEYKFCIIHVYASKESIIQRKKMLKGDAYESASTASSPYDPPKSLGSRTTSNSSSYSVRNTPPSKRTSSELSYQKIARSTSRQVSSQKKKRYNDDAVKNKEIVNCMNEISQLAQEAYFDLSVIVDNDQDMPILLKVEDYSPSWQCTLGRHFGSIKEQPNGFPAALPSLNLDRTIFSDLIEEGYINFSVIEHLQNRREEAEDTNDDFERQVEIINDSDINQYRSIAENLPSPRVQSNDEKETDALIKSDILQENEKLIESSIVNDMHLLSHHENSLITDGSEIETKFLSRNVSSSDIEDYIEGIGVDASEYKSQYLKKILITACSPNQQQACLPSAKKEADKIKDLMKADNRYLAVTPDDCSPEKLRDSLIGMNCWHIVAHIDFPLYNESTIAFVNPSGTICSIHQDALVNLVQSISVANGGSLEMIFLNGCSGEELAKRFFHECRIPHVVYWSSRVEDEAGYHFGIFFWEAVLRGSSYCDACQLARTDVEMKILIESNAEVYGSTNVPKFIMQVSPDDENLVVEKDLVRYYKPDVIYFETHHQIPRRPAGIVSCLSEDDAIAQIKGLTKVEISVAKDWEDIPRDSSTLLEIVEATFDGRVEMYMSPQSPVNLDGPSKERAGIPADAAYFTWLYPLSSSEALKKVRFTSNNLQFDMSNPELELLWVGGFLYFNFQGKVVAANAVSSNLQSHQGESIDFFPPEVLSDEDAIVLREKGRWFPVTIPSMLDVGAKYFAWIMPREALRTRIYPALGSFAYLFCDLDFDKQTSKKIAERPKNIIFAVKPKVI